MSDPKIEWSGELSLSDLGREAVAHLTVEECDTVNDPDNVPKPEAQPDRANRHVTLMLRHDPTKPTEHQYYAESQGPVVNGIYQVPAFAVLGRSPEKCIAEMRFQSALHLYESNQISNLADAREYLNDFEFLVYTQ